MANNLGFSASDLRKIEKIVSEHQTELLERWKIAGGGYGIHWPDVDEDLSVEGLLRGLPAPRVSVQVAVEAM